MKGFLVRFEAFESDSERFNEAPRTQTKRRSARPDLEERAIMAYLAMFDYGNIDIISDIGDRGQWMSA